MELWLVLPMTLLHIRWKWLSHVRALEVGCCRDSTMMSKLSWLCVLHDLTVSR